MVLLFMSNFDSWRHWRDALEKEIPGLEFRKWPDETGDPAEIDYTLVWKPKPGALLEFPNLKAIFSLGAGVDHILMAGEGTLPAGIPVIKLVDEVLARDMTQYVVHWVLHFHRAFDRYGEQQRDAAWKRLHYPEAPARRIGILGQGNLGAAAAEMLARFEFDVAGWSRSPKSIAGVESFHGPDGLRAFLARTEILVCLLPLTPETVGIINADTLAALPEGAHLINPARGGHVVEEDLVAALNSGHIAGAVLDVFRDEPLPTDHPFWRHPRIRVTPHIASHTTPRSAARQVARNIRRIEDGLAPENLVDPERMY